MRLFRAKKYFANGAGFIYEGQVFLVEDPSKLPHPTAQPLSDCYEEIVSPNPFVPLKKVLKIVGLS